MIDDDRIRRMQERVKSLGNVGELHLEAVENLRQISIAVDEFSFVGILKTEDRIEGFENLL